MRLVRALARLARWLALACAIAAGLMLVALYDEGEKVALVVVAAAPAVVLFLFSLALREAAELPARLRGAPAEAAQLRQALEDAGRARGRRLPRALWRIGRQTASARDLAIPWAPLLPLLNPPFLGATAISALATPLVVVVALVVLVAYS